MRDNMKSLGVYRVQDKVFLNKVHAMLYAELVKSHVTWDFRSEVFDNIDWKIPVEKTLKELYRERAVQIRESYDYVSLLFSGGVDSANILKTFIDNDIHLDEVVMYMPKALDANASFDLDKTNIDSEILYAALPYLRNYLKTTKTKVRIIDFIPITKKLLVNENLLAQYNNSIQSLSFHIIPKLAMMTLDEEWNSLYDKGVNVCHLHGAEKPMVNYSYTHGYSFQFTDIVSWKFLSEYTTASSEAREKHQFHELFYWTGDLPELVIKQCQLVKAKAEEDPFFRYALSSKTLVGYENFKALNPIIYDQSVIAIRKMFTTNKLGWETDLNEAPWDWANKTLENSERNVLNNTMQNVRSALPQKYFLQTPKVKDRLINFSSKKYTL